MKVELRCWLETSGASKVKLETAALESKEKGNKEIDHFRLVWGRFNKHRSLHTRLVLGSHQTSKSLNPSPGSLKFIQKS